MVASENLMSPLAMRLLANDMVHRYNERDEVSHYAGTRYLTEIEELTASIFSERFRTPYVDVRPISGAVANMCALRAFLKPGDVFVSPGLTAGGHVSTTRYGIAGGLGLRDIPMFFDHETMSVDVDMTVRLIRQVRPKVVVFGRSVILFPEPVREVREEVGDQVKIMYDAAHVFGLIYAGLFQQPLDDGADVMTASTHKTFPGPQGGIIIGSRRLYVEDWRRVQRAVFPGTVSNHHINRLPALAVTALEMNEFGREYAEQVVRNARSLAEELYDLGFRVLCPDRGFTETHQVLVDVRELGGGRKVSETLERANIIVTKIALPWDADRDATGNPSGIRIGVQELTRLGMGDGEMREVARLFARVLLKGESPESVRRDVVELRASFREVKYCFPDELLRVAADKPGT